MWVVTLSAFLLHGSVHTAQSDIYYQTHTEGTDAFLICNNNNVNVSWSKGVVEGRREIITAKHEENPKKFLPDPDHRFSVLGDLSLYIKNVSRSDSGIYYCNSVPVINLIITPLQNSTPTTEKYSTENGNIGETTTMKEDSDEKDKTSTTDADLGEKRVTSTRSQSNDNSGEEGDKNETPNLTRDPPDESKDNDNRSLWAVPVVVALICLVVLLVVLLVWRFFSKRKTGRQTHVYDSITNLPADLQPGFSATQNQNLYDPINNLADSQCGDQQREKESVYYLAQKPTTKTTGGQERKNESVYFLATTPTSETTDRAASLYSMIQKT